MDIQIVQLFLGVNNYNEFLVMDFLYGMMVFFPMYVATLWAIVLLWEPGSQNRAKHFLGFFMSAAAVLYFCHAAYFSSQFKLYLYLDTIYLMAMLSVYPLYYLYLKLLTVEGTLNKSSYKLLIPAIVFGVVIAVLYLLMDKPFGFVLKYQFRHDVLPENNSMLWQIQHLVIVLAKITFFIQIIWVLKNGLKLIHAYNKRIREFYSDLEGRSVDWAKWMIIVFSVTGLMSAVANVIGRSFFQNHSIFLLISSLVFGILIFIIGFLGNLQNHSVYNLKIDENDTDDSNNLAPVDKIAIRDKIVNAGYLLKLKKQFLVLFEQQKVYRKNDMKISHICNLLNTNRTYISKLINDEFGCSFSYFVNEYRLKEAKEIIKNNIDVEIKLEQVAEKVGFTSAGSLIRNFKQYYGQTPGAYRESIKSK